MNKSIQNVLQLGVCGLILTCGACEQREEEALAAGADGPGKAAIPVPKGDKKVKSIGEILDRKVSVAVADLSRRTGIAPDAITVTQASIVNWGSSAVGCPKEGMNYTQAIVPGLLVLLEADGKIYRYHGSNNNELFHCPDDRAEAPAYGSGEEFM